MKYSVASNFDKELITAIAPLNTVESVYGKLSHDIIGGGRLSHVLPKVSLRELKEHIAFCHGHGIRFNYLLNASCLDNIELTPKNKDIFNFTDQLLGMGVDEFTVANINLLRILRLHYPEVPLVSSLFLQPGSIKAIKHLEEAGANDITLFYNFTRNFDLLEKAVALSEPETRLRILANNSCLHECSELGNHANYFSHMTQSVHGTVPFTYDTYRLNCGLEKILNPAKLISSDWVRPEDVHFYDTIGKGKIILKLTDRIATTAWLIRAVKAYAVQRWDGNLMDILNYPGNRMLAHLDRSNIIKGILKRNIKPSNFKRFAQASRLIPVYIDNRKLDGFLEGMQKIHCPNRLCNDRGWKNDGQENNALCSYCKSYAEKAVSFDEGERQEAINVTRSLIDDIWHGKR